MENRYLKKRKKVLVTGANGYIGRNVIKALQNRKDFYVIATSKNEINYETKNVKFVKFDILNDKITNNIYSLFDSPNIVIHLAWRNGFQHNSPSHLLDLSKHFEFLKTLIDSGVSQLVVAGSFREYGKCNGLAKEKKSFSGLNMYTLSKLSLKKALEIYLKDKSTILQWIRPFSLYGDDTHNNSILTKIYRASLNGEKTFPFTMGNEEYDYESIEDLSNQIIAVASQDKINGVIDLCSGKSVKLSEVAEKFIKDKNLNIKLDYGAFKTRKYDSPCIYGNVDKINKIFNNH